MTDFASLMQQRIALVEKLAALNSKQLLNTQTRSGIEVELLTCIEAIERATVRAKLLFKHGLNWKRATKQQQTPALPASRNWMSWRKNSPRWINRSSSRRGLQPRLV